jgi:hypothetical protein
MLSTYSVTLDAEENNTAFFTALMDAHDVSLAGAMAAS